MVKKIQLYLYILKYKLRTFIVIFLGFFLKPLGFSWEFLSKLFNRELFFVQGRHLRTREPKNPKNSIYFLTLEGGNTHLTATEMILATFFKKKGYDVTVILCDKQYPICERKHAGDEIRWEKECANCHMFGKSMVKSFGLKHRFISDFIKDVDSPTIDLSNYVNSALQKHFKMGVIESSPEVENKRNLLLKSAEISAKVGQKIKLCDPDLVIMSHGIYTTWGPAKQIINDANIPHIIYGRGKKRATININWTNTADWWDIAKEWDRLKNIDLTSEETSIIDDYLASRRDHSKDALVYNFGQETSKKDTYKTLGLDPKKDIYVLFTNVIWDAASVQREICFDNPINWVIETIDWFKNHGKDKQLVIKVHPSESVIGTNQSFVKIIDDHFETLPENIKVIKPEAKVNSWSIINIANAGLVHTSTIGMELALEGVPSLIVSDTYYRGKGFTLDIKNKNEYFHMLEKNIIDFPVIPNMKQLAKKYLYILFERYQLPFDFFIEPSYNMLVGLKETNLETLLKNETLNLIQESIEKKEDFLKKVNLK